MKRNNDIENEFLSMLEQNVCIIIKISNIYANTSQDRKELTSDIIFELWKSYPRFKGNSQASTWVYRVALNIALKSKRKRDNNKILFFDELFTISSNSSIYSNEEDIAETKQLYKCIEQLDPMNKAIVLLYLDEKSNSEIGTIMGISRTNVSTRLTRIREHLKQCIIKNEDYGN